MRNKWTVIKKPPSDYPEDGLFPCYHFNSSVSHNTDLSMSFYLKNISAVTGGPVRTYRMRLFLHPFSPATPKPCSMKLSSFPRTMSFCLLSCTMSGILLSKAPGNLSAKTICTDVLLSSISCTLFFIVFDIKIIVCIITSCCIRR